jgi:hypothetical protein
MKTNLYLLLILLSISTLSFAQKTLQAINKTTGEVIVIKEYNIVKFYSKSGVFKGEMRFLDTSSILVKDAYFTLADIKAIEYSSNQHKANRPVGIGLMVVGYCMVTAGALDLLLHYIVNEIGYDVPYTRPLALLGGGAISIASGIRIFGKKALLDNSSYTFKIQG